MEFAPHPAFARLADDRCPICEGELGPAQIEVTQFAEADPSYVDGPPFCEACDVGFAIDDPGTPRQRLWMSRHLTPDELERFHRPYEPPEVDDDAEELDDEIVRAHQRAMDQARGEAV